MPVLQFKGKTAIECYHHTEDFQDETFRFQVLDEGEHKDRAATLWCENASVLTGKTWKYLKVPQKEFEKLQPELLAEVAVLKTT